MVRMAASSRARRSVRAAVADGPGASDEAGAIEAGHRAADLGRVQLERGSERSRRRRAVAAQFEEEARLGQRVRGVQVSAAECADARGVEAVEAAHRLGHVGRTGSGHPGLLADEGARII
jgi:hypothetical protein